MMIDSNILLCYFFIALGTWWIKEDHYPNSYLAPVQYLNCGGKLQTALTHTDRVFMQKSVLATWQSPSDFLGSILFRATVVQDYKTYWKDVVSKPINIVAKMNEELEKEEKSSQVELIESRKPRKSREKILSELRNFPEKEDEQDSDLEGKDRIARLVPDLENSAPTSFRGINKLFLVILGLFVFLSDVILVRP